MGYEALTGSGFRPNYVLVNRGGIFMALVVRRLWRVPGAGHGCRGNGIFLNRLEVTSCKMFS